MTEYFRSAINYLSSSGGAGGLPGRSDHSLVGQTVEVGGLKLRIRTLIAEGGFSLVFAATDAQNEVFALKRLLSSDQAASDAILLEIRLLRQLTGHPNIVRYVQAASLSPQESGHGSAEFLVLTELCSGGPVVDVLQRRHLTPEQVLRVFHGACQAVKHMHVQSPPITHRDLKIENLLLDASGAVKLCDFGSATTSAHQPDHSWTATQRSMVEDELTCHTTPMYRAPEMLDLYLDYPIGPAMDIWALGCVLYYLCYRSHPFEDSAKLRILNAKYSLPEQPSPFSPFHPIIQSLLQIDPRRRPSAGELCERLQVLAVALDCDPAAPLREFAPSTAATPPPRPPPPVQQQQHAPAADAPPPPPSANLAGSAGVLFGSIRGQAGSLLKNLKDTSAKVVQTVQAGVGGRGPDLSYVTSRLVVAPLADGLPDTLLVPAEEALYSLLEQRHNGVYAIYNLSCRKLKFDYGGRLSHISIPGFAAGRPPPLKTLLLLCANMSQWLHQKLEHVCVLTGSEAYCNLAAAALLLYCRLLPNPLSVVELISRRRPAVKLSASFHRYLDCLAALCNDGSLALVRSRTLQLTCVRLQPLPLFNRARTGCRPFVQVWSASERLYSSQQDYERLKAYELGASDCVELPMDVLASGDVTVALFHARSSLGGRVVALPICSVTFHTAFPPADAALVHFAIGQLDGVDDAEGRFPPRFHMQLCIGETVVDETAVECSYDAKSVSPRRAVSGRDERDKLYNDLGIRERASSSEKQAAVASTNGSTSIRVAAERPDFLSTLEWQVGGETASAAPDNSSLDDRPPSAGRRQQAADVAEACERAAGIRVSSGGGECERAETPPSDPAPVAVANLLDLGASFTESSDPPASTQRQVPMSFDPFAHFEAHNKTPEKSSSSAAFFDVNAGVKTAPVDLLSDWSLPVTQQSHPPTGAQPGLRPPSGMQRNVSAPAFGDAAFAHSNMDLFDQLPTVASTKANQASMGAAATPPMSRPNYGRTNWDASAHVTGGGVKPRVNADAFDDILSSQGFQSTARQQANTTIGALVREVEIEGLDPVAIRIRDWTKGKERNIRALLGALHEVLWDNADRWEPCSMSQLLTAAQVKKHYRKACLVVHPDKQTGLPHEDLAKAVFTELNDAWNDFEAAGQPSLG